jgi:hypothetical protein
MLRPIRNFLLCLAAVVTPTLAHADEGNRFRADLVSFEEVPAIAAPATASLRMELSPDGTTLTFELTYQDLSAPPLAAHIHFGQRRVNGAVVVFFCGGGGKPACPATTSASISGTIVAADVIAVPAQGIAAGDLETVLDFLRRGLGYANMHTPNHPGGELRGQVVAGHSRDHVN